MKPFPCWSVKFMVTSVHVFLNLGSSYFYSRIKYLMSFDLRLMVLHRHSYDMKYWYGVVKLSVVMCSRQIYLTSLEGTQTAWRAGNFIDYSPDVLGFLLL